MFENADLFGLGNDYVCRIAFIVNSLDDIGTEVVTSFIYENTFI